MDPPRHDEQRKIVAPIVAPPNLAKMSGTIRERAVRILEGLPRGEVFDWVDRVSIELTTQMLSTLFDFPFEERRTLTRWSNVSTVNTRAGTEIDSEEKRDAVLQEMLAYFAEVWKIRQKQPPKFDLISMLAHGEATRDLPSRPQEFMGNLLLLIVGGNDTTRNSISGGLWFLNQFPEEYAKLRADPGLIPKMVPEIIRYQSPVVHMRRTALVRCRVERQAHPQGRQGRDVVHLGQPRSRRDRGPGPFHHRSPAAASAFVLRVRHSPLRRQPAGGDAADDPVGGNPEALPADRGRGEAEASLLKPDPRHHRDESAHPGINPPAPAGPVRHQGAGPADLRGVTTGIVPFGVSIAIHNRIADWYLVLLNSCGRWHSLGRRSDGRREHRYVETSPLVHCTPRRCSRTSAPAATPKPAEVGETEIAPEPAV